MSPGWTTLVVLFAVVEIAYLGSLAVSLFFYAMPTNWIDPAKVEQRAGRADNPPILLLYPVLREAEATMRTTMLTIATAVATYAPSQARVLAIPNHDDAATIASLERLQGEFGFLDICRVPPTTSPAWAPVWSDWDTNAKAYWWHTGKRAGSFELPPKKTRQMIFALYTFAAKLPGQGWLMSYIDADSAVPPEYFHVGAAGNEDYAVTQLTNVCGNLTDTWSAAFHATDHMAWDGAMYPHMSANGKHPFYVLGKGLFFRVADLVELGGFHPWLTIEDPEVGIRLWANGRRLGISDSYLVEEVPATFRGGVLQRKRWVAGFFQTLTGPLTLMGLTFRQRVRARLNLVPTLSLATNTVGLPVGVWALVEASRGLHFPLWTVVIAGIDVVLAAAAIAKIMVTAWLRSGRVLATRRARVGYLLRVNPLFLLGWWLFWTIPLVQGFLMFVRDSGLVWERTEKADANHELVRSTQVIDLRDAVDREGVSVTD